MSDPELLIVIGTRPEAIKLAPVIRAFTARGMRHRILVVRSGQHDELLEGTSIGPDTDIRLPILPKDLDLEETRCLLDRRFQEIMHRYLNKGLEHVLVQGDTSSAYCAARAAKGMALHVHHLEAGLRTGNLTDPYPEEFHRCAISGYADTHYAPTPLAIANLLKEGIPADRIHLTGNTIIDELLFKDMALPEGPRDTVLITLHRFENREHLPGLLRSINSLAKRNAAFTFLWARHPNPAIRVPLDAHVREGTMLHIVEPLTHQELVRSYHRCALVMTDSGGVQEEASHLGIPLIVLRTLTERQEALAPNHCVLCPPDRPDQLEQSFSALLGRQRCPNPAFGDGRASIRIVDHLIQMLNDR